mgnify:CR=1 FL=1
MSLSIKQIVMIKSLIVFLLLLAPLSLSDEARPVYIEITENSETKIGVKWKLPPVMTPSDEPLIYIKSDSCAQDGNALGTRLLGSSEYTCKPAPQYFLIKIERNIEQNSFINRSQNQSKIIRKSTPNWLQNGIQNRSDDHPHFKTRHQQRWLHGLHDEGSI